jgi:hypothetical protein
MPRDKPRVCIIVRRQRSLPYLDYLPFDEPEFVTEYLNDLRLGIVG